MHQEQLDLRYREVESLTKRNNQLQDQWTRLDIECNRLSEDLQVANGRVEQLRNESANLRAEKDIWQVGLLSLLNYEWLETDLIFTGHSKPSSRREPHIGIGSLPSF